jgi:hypothetical protein
MNTRKYQIRFLTEMLGTVTKETKGKKIDGKDWTGFHKDKKGLFLYDYHIKGFLKHTARIFKESKEEIISSAILEDKLLISPRIIYLRDEDGTIKDKPDGEIEKSMRVLTTMGPRVISIISDKVNKGTILEFEVTLLPNKILTWELINKFFDYGKLKGIGQFRNSDYGKFETKTKTQGFITTFIVSIKNKNSK